MAQDAFFDDPEWFHRANNYTPWDYRVCRRCGGLVADLKQHLRWHGVVDTNQTTVLQGSEAI